MIGYSVAQDGTAQAYRRRLDLAHELVQETGREDWALRLGMINEKRDDKGPKTPPSAEKVVL